MQASFSNEKQLYTICFLTIIVLLYYITSPEGFNTLLTDQNLGTNTHKEIKGHAQIIDGDSIIVANHEIRILHIDAPEYKQTCTDKNNNEYPCGQDTKIFLAKSLSKHPTICKISGKDVYNRYLANCSNNNRDISELMIKNGWAIIYKQPSFYFSDQEYARLNKLGIWQGDFLIPKIYRKLNPR